MGSKTAELYADFESIEKVMWNQQKSEKWSFHFYYCVQKFWASNILQFLLTLKSNSDEKGSKERNVYYKCVLEFHFASISGSILLKKVKIIEP